MVSSAVPRVSSNLRASTAEAFFAPIRWVAEYSPDAGRPEQLVQAALSRHLALLPESPGRAAGLSLDRAQLRLPRLGNRRYLLDLKSRVCQNN
jgi:hypothetical protein